MKRKLIFIVAGIAMALSSLGLADAWWDRSLASSGAYFVITNFAITAIGMIAMICVLRMGQA